MSFSDFVIKGSSQKSNFQSIGQDPSLDIDQIQAAAVESLKKISVDDLFSANSLENQHVLQVSIINYPAVLSFLVASQYFNIDIGYSFIKLIESKFYENNPIIEQAIDTISQDPIKRKKVIETLNFYIEKNPFDLMLISHRASLYTLNKQQDLALKDYDFILEKNSSDVNAFLNRGMIKFQLNDLSAITDFESFLNVLGVKNTEEYLYQNPLDSNLLEVLLILSQMYFKVEKHAQAIDQMLILKKYVEGFTEEYFTMFDQFPVYKKNLDLWLKSIILLELKEKGFNAHREKNWDQSIECFDLFLKTLSSCQKYYKIDDEIINLAGEVYLCKGIAHVKKEEVFVAIDCFFFVLSLPSLTHEIRLYALFYKAISSGLINNKEDFFKGIENYLLALTNTKDISDIPATVDVCENLINDFGDKELLFKMKYNKLKSDIHNKNLLNHLIDFVINLGQSFIKEILSKKDISDTLCKALEFHLSTPEEMLNSLYRFYHMIFKSILKDYKAAFEDFSLLDCYHLDQNFGDTQLTRINYVTNAIVNSISRNDLDDFARKNPKNVTAIYLKIQKKFSDITTELLEDIKLFLINQRQQNVNTSMIGYMKCNLLLLLVNQDVQVNEDIKNKLKTIVFDHQFMETVDKIELYKRFVIICMKLKDNKSIEELLNIDFYKNISENSNVTEIELKLQTFMYAGMERQAFIFTKYLPKKFWSTITCIKKLNITTLYARILYLNSKQDESATIFMNCITACTSLIGLAAKSMDKELVKSIIEKKIKVLEELKFIIKEMNIANPKANNLRSYLDFYLKQLPNDKELLELNKIFN